MSSNIVVDPSVPLKRLFMHYPNKSRGPESGFFASTIFVQKYFAFLQHP